MSGQLEALRKVAAFDAKILELEEKQRQIPLLIQQKAECVRQAAEDLAAKEAELKAFRVKTEVKEKELHDAEQTTIKLRNQINQAKSNKEFQALQHEILSHEADNARLEDAVLQQMQKMDRLREERDRLAEEAKKIEAEVAGERKALEAEQNVIDSQADGLRGRRNEAAKGVSADIFAKYERLIGRRGQTAMVPVVGGTCQGCFMTLRPETMAQLKKGGDLVVCHSCGRILCLED